MNNFVFRSRAFEVVWGSGVTPAVQNFRQYMVHILVVGRKIYILQFEEVCGF